MTSSHRPIPECEAVLHREDDHVGPMRLPTKEPIDFVEEFNRKYRSIGLKIQSRDDLRRIEAPTPSPPDAG